MALADLYINGYEPDWDLLFKGFDYHRVPLPTYPFARDSYWITEPELSTFQKTQLERIPVPVLDEKSIKENIQKDLIQFIQNILKVRDKDVDIDQGMLDYGFDSILFLEFIKQINTTYGINFSGESFFDLGTPTIRTLSETLYNQFKERLIDHFRKSSENISPPPPQTGQVIQTFQAEGGMKQQRQRIFEPMAIIGLGAIIPQTPDLDTLWKHLENGNNLNSNTYKKNESDNNDKQRSTLDTVNLFDADFFEITRDEVKKMSPHQYILLETAWKAIEDAGYKSSDLSGTKTGVFIGVSSPILCNQKNTPTKNKPKENSYWTNDSNSMAANAISFYFNLHGPSEVIDTGWSSSLAALHRATEAILHGVCEMAIVGGINILSEINSKGNGNSKEKYEVPGEGAGVLLLKPLSQAISNGDHIYASIKGTAENHFGRTGESNGRYTAVLNELLQAAYEKNHIDPATITYFDTEGISWKNPTANSTDLEIITAAFTHLYEQQKGEKPKESYCAIDSARYNMGNLQSAAGIAGIIKVLLALEHKKLPPVPTTESEKLQSAIKGTPFYFESQCKSWEAIQGLKNQSLPRRAGITSLAPGGTNVHVLVEEWKNPPQNIEMQKPDTNQKQEKNQYIILLSARNREDLKLYAKKLLQFLEKKANNSSQSYDKVELKKKIEDDILKISNDTLTTGKDGYDASSVKDFIIQVNKKYDLDIKEETFYNQASPGAFIKYLRKKYQEKFINYYTSGKGTSIHNHELADIAFTLQRGRENMAERLALVVTNIEELKQKLKSFCQNKTNIENLYKGNVNQTFEQFTPLMEGEEKEEFIKHIIKNRKLNKLAYCWILGIEIDWNLLYLKNRLHRVSLPTYPFKREKN